MNFNSRRGGVADLNANVDPMTSILSPVCPSSPTALTDALRHFLFNSVQMHPSVQFHRLLRTSAAFLQMCLEAVDV